MLETFQAKEKVSRIVGKEEKERRPKTMSVGRTKSYVQRENLEK